MCSAFISAPRNSKYARVVISSKVRCWAWVKLSHAFWMAIGGEEICWAWITCAISNDCDCRAIVNARSRISLKLGINGVMISDKRYRVIRTGHAPCRFYHSPHAHRASFHRAFPTVTPYKIIQPKPIVALIVHRAMFFAVCSMFMLQR